MEGTRRDSKVVDRAGAGAKNWLVRFASLVIGNPIVRFPFSFLSVEGARRVSQAIDRISAGAAWIASWLVLFACLVSAGNAIVRYLFSYSSNAFLEIQWYMFGALVLLGAAYTLRMNEHVRVDLIYSSLSEEKQAWVDVVGFVFFFLPVVSYLTWISIPLFTQSFRSGEVSSSAGGLTIWPAKLMIPVGFALLTLQGISELIKRILILQGRMHLDVKYEKPLQ